MTGINRDGYLKLSEAFDAEGAICCPCGDENVHPRETSIYHPGDGEWNGTGHGHRGYAHTIPMWCESNCSFDLVVGFHKGMTYLWTHNHRLSSDTTFEEDARITEAEMES